MEKQVKKPRLFGMWFGIALICGLVTAGLLVGLIWVTLGNIIGGSPEINTYSYGQGLVALIASVVVFGVLYIVSTLKSGKVLKEKLANTEAIKVISIIYAVFLGIPAVVMLIMFIVPLVELGVGTSTNVNGTIANLVCSFLSLAVLAKMALYQLGVRHKFMNHKVWAIVFSVFTAVIIALFMVFPGSHLRDVTRDQKVVLDLENISDSIRDYFDENGKLPVDLSTLAISDLNWSVDNYKYSVKDSTVSSYLKYEICADFISNTGATTTYGFDYHPSGNVCFERSIYNYTYRSSSFYD